MKNGPADIVSPPPLRRQDIAFPEEEWRILMNGLSRMNLEEIHDLSGHIKDSLSLVYHRIMDKIMNG